MQCRYLKFKYQYRKLRLFSLLALRASTAAVKTQWLLPFFMLASCGESPAPSLNPTAVFEQFYESGEANLESCGRESGYGCGQVIASGNMVGGSFTFEDLLVSCGNVEEGLYIDLFNVLGDNPTFHLRLTIWQVTHPRKVQICSGASWSENNSQYAQAGSCDLIAKIHGQSVSASANQPCLVLFNDSENWQGTIACKQLDDTKKYLIIDGASHFRCPT